MGLAAPAFGQTISGGLEGRVVDATGAAVRAAIWVDGSSLSGKRTVTAEENGRFRLGLLPPGTYRVTVQYTALQPVAITGVSVWLGRTTSMGEIRLLPSEVKETVVVVSRSPWIDPTTAAIATSLGRTDIAGLPFERDDRAALALVPHANPSFLAGDGVNLAGGHGADTAYFVDGIHVNEPVRGDAGVSLPHNFVEAIEVRVGGYEAEFGRSQGAVVNLVTPTGGDRFRGEAFAFFTSDTLAADRRLGYAEARVVGTRLGDAGLSLQGPLRGRLRVFGAYDAVLERRSVDVPSQGLLVQRSTRHRFAAKLGWQVDDRTDLALTAIGDPGSKHDVGPAAGILGAPTVLANAEPLLGRRKLGGVSALARVRHTLGTRWAVEVAGTWLERQETNIADPERGLDAPLVIDLETGTWSDGYGVAERFASRRIAGDLRVTGMLGSHLAKAGVEYQDNLLDADLPFDIIYRAERNWTWWENRQGGPVRVRVPTVFMQDSWQVGERLRMNAGVRWDGLFCVGADGRAAEVIKDQFQPRVGFAWLLSRSGKAKLSGSFGRFFEQVPTWYAFAFHTPGLQRFTRYDHDPRLDPSGGVVFSEVEFGTLDPVQGLRGQHFDEFTVGYEHQATDSLVLAARGIYRTLREAIANGFDADRSFHRGNPGRAGLSYLPRARHRYAALEFAARGRRGDAWQWGTSYVLSRTDGNYTGVYSADAEVLGPNVGPQFLTIEQVSDGLLPNDRTHVFKVHAVRRFDFGLSAGTVAVWQSGTPLSEFGGTWLGPPVFGFLGKRGLAGRTQSTYDLNLRLVYRINSWERVRPSLQLDLLHIASLRRPVVIDQRRYFRVDSEGRQIDPNPQYGGATAYQLPLMARVGVAVAF